GWFHLARLFHEGLTSWPTSFPSWRARRASPPTRQRWAWGPSCRSSRATCRRRGTRRSSRRCPGPAGWSPRPPAREGAGAGGGAAERGGAGGGLRSAVGAWAGRVFGSKVDGTAALVAAATRMGFSAEQAQAFIPAVLGFLKGRLPPEVMNQVGGLFPEPAAAK